MSGLDGWVLGEHTASGVTHPTYRKGKQPGPRCHLRDPRCHRGRRGVLRSGGRPGVHRGDSAPVREVPSSQAHDWSSRSAAAP